MVKDGHHPNRGNPRDGKHGDDGNSNTRVCAATERGARGQTGGPEPCLSKTIKEDETSYLVAGGPFPSTGRPLRCLFSARRCGDHGRSGHHSTSVYRRHRRRKDIYTPEHRCRALDTHQFSRSSRTSSSHTHCHGHEFRHSFGFGPTDR